MNETPVILYTDGACKGNPGPGGWGVWLQYGGHQKELWGGEAQTTNNRMELTAVIQGLRALKRSCPVEIFTDSQYVHQGITQWLAKWQQNQWRNAKKEPVKNKDLWEQLAELANQHQITWHWVKGHANDPGNDKADALANRGCSSIG